MARKSKRQALSIPRAVFGRLVREISQDAGKDVKWQPEAVRRLQTAAEDMLQDKFFRAGRIARLCKVDTVRREHMRELDCAIVKGAADI